WLQARVRMATAEGEKPWPYAKVFWRRGEGEWKDRWNGDADGLYVLEKMSAGPVDVVAFMFPPDRPLPPDAPITRADPSAGPVALLAYTGTVLAYRLGPLEGSEVESLRVSRVSP